MNFFDKLIAKIKAWFTGAKAKAKTEYAQLDDKIDNKVDDFTDRYKEWAAKEAAEKQAKAAAAEARAAEARAAEARAAQDAESEVKTIETTVDLKSVVKPHIAKTRIKAPMVKNATKKK